MWHNNWVDSHTDRAVLCAGDSIQNRLTKMRSGLYPIFHIALLNDFSSFALWMSDNLFESVRFSVAIRCGVSPEGTVAVEIFNYDVRLDSLFQWRELERFRECTTTPGSSTVMNSTFSSSHTETLFTFRPSLTKSELPCLLCGRSATSVIPGIFGLAWSLARCVSWRHRQWQCCILHNSYSMHECFIS